MTCEHAQLEIADFITGRLGPERVREIEAHLDTCAECRADFVWARQFRDAATAAGLRHLGAARILEIADRQGEPTTSEENRHLEGCAACSRELAWVRGLPEPEPRAEARARGPLPHRTDAGDREPGRGRTRLRFPQPWWRAATFAAAASVALFLLWPGRQRDVSDWARIEPLPVRMPRGAGSPDPFQVARTRALESYAAGDYQGARRDLLAAVELQPQNAEVNLYLGSSELLLGHASEAAVVLRRSADLAADDLVREEALWQLANAQLAGGRREDSIRTLRDVVALGRGHRVEAAALLGRLGERGE